MDMEQLKSEEQMEMMMMMQMEKLPELCCGAYNDVAELPPSDFCGATSMVSNYIENPDHVASPSFMNMNLPSTTISFTKANPPVHQEPASSSSPTTAQAFLCAGGGGRSINNAFSQKRNSMAAMREMIFRIAAMQPIHIDPESVKPPKRRNVKISKDPQSVAARHRRERISERIRILQRLVPGGTKMDTASMLDEAIHYVKFLKTQVQSLERAAANTPTGMGFPVPIMSTRTYLPSLPKPYQPPDQNLHHFGDA